MPTQPLARVQVQVVVVPVSFAYDVLGLRAGEQTQSLARAQVLVPVALAADGLWQRV